MSLGSHIPAWRELRDALAALVDACGATSAAIIDETNALWCATPTSREVHDSADSFYRREVADRRGVPLRRGGRLCVVRAGSPTEPGYLAESFAGVYVLIAWFAVPFATDLAQVRLGRDQMRQALPRIEALVVALPPHDGPGAGEGVRGKRA